MPARLKAALQPSRLYRAARFAWHFVRDPVFRRDHLLLWRRPRNLFQYRSITAPDRNPALFAFVRDRLAGTPAPRLLSFGCAMGDEVFSLRGYFPSALIKGIDINPANIAAAEARRRLAGSDASIVFACLDSAAAEPAASYDAVFCLSVFVRWKLREQQSVRTCAPHLRFADFERATAGLAAAVKPGGLLVIRHAMFRFTDTAAMADFQAILSLPPKADFFPRFDRHDQRLPDSASEEVVFQKRPLPPRRTLPQRD